MPLILQLLQLTDFLISLAFFFFLKGMQGMYSEDDRLEFRADENQIMAFEFHFQLCN